MARIAGQELSNSWRLDYALTRIRGIGWPLSAQIVEKLKMDPSTRLSKLDPTQTAQITTTLEEYLIEGDLARKIRQDIQRLREIGSYRGSRHARGLPARGQRTRSNARTKRGKRKTVGAFKKEVLAKMTTTDKK
jgi:small subunit ribosomal protein S13